MAEYSAGNSFVGEDWECECYDSSDPVVQTGSINTTVLLQCEPGERRGDDVSGESNEPLLEHLID